MECEKIHAFVLKKIVLLPSKIILQDYYIHPFLCKGNSFIFIDIAGAMFNYAY